MTYEIQRTFLLPHWALQSGSHRQWLYSFGVVRSTESSQATKILSVCCVNIRYDLGGRARVLHITQSIVGVQAEISPYFTWLSFRFLRGAAIKCSNDSEVRRYSWSLSVGKQEGDHPLNNNCSEYTKTPRHGDTLGSGGLVPCILSLGSSWVWAVSFTVWSL
jgi:hypothetical protein